MRKHASTIATVALVVAVVFLSTARQPPLQGQARPEVRFAAVPGEKGGQDTFGAYDIVPDWPKPITSLPGYDAQKFRPRRGANPAFLVGKPIAPQ